MPRKTPKNGNVENGWKLYHVVFHKHPVLCLYFPSESLLMRMIIALRRALLIAPSGGMRSRAFFRSSIFNLFHLSFKHYCCTFFVRRYCVIQQFVDVLLPMGGPTITQHPSFYAETANSNFCLCNHPDSSYGYTPSLFARGSRVYAICIRN